MLGVVTLVEICTTVVAPVLEHSELLKPGEDRPEARSISLSVSSFRTSTSQLEEGHPQKAKEVSSHRVTRGTSLQA